MQVGSGADFGLVRFRGSPVSAVGRTHLAADAPDGLTAATRVPLVTSGPFGGRCSLEKVSTNAGHRGGTLGQSTGMEDQDAAWLELDRLARCLLAAHACSAYVTADPTVAGLLAEVRALGDAVPFLRRLLGWTGFAYAELERASAGRGQRITLDDVCELAAEIGVPPVLAAQVAEYLHLAELPDELVEDELARAAAGIVASYDDSWLLGTSALFVHLAMETARLRPTATTHRDVLAGWFLAAERSRCTG